MPSTRVNIEKFRDTVTLFLAAPDPARALAELEWFTLCVMGAIIPADHGGGGLLEELAFLRDEQKGRRAAALSCTCGRGPAEHFRDCPERACRSHVGPRYNLDPATMTWEAPTPTPPKPPLEYLGDVTRALSALALQLEFGAARPGRKRGCWREVYAPPEKRQEVYGKVLRHVLAAMSGEVLDEHQRPHLVAALTDLAILVELQASTAPAKEGE